jgi:hypothetical protein
VEENILSTCNGDFLEKTFFHVFQWNNRFLTLQSVNSDTIFLIKITEKKYSNFTQDTAMACEAYCTRRVIHPVADNSQIVPSWIFRYESVQILFVGDTKRQG